MTGTARQAIIGSFQIWCSSNKNIDKQMNMFKIYRTNNYHYLTTIIKVPKWYSPTQNVLHLSYQLSTHIKMEHVMWCFYWACSMLHWKYPSKLQMKGNNWDTFHAVIVCNLTLIIYRKWGNNYRVKFLRFFVKSEGFIVKNHGYSNTAQCLKWKYKRTQNLV